MYCDKADESRTLRLLVNFTSVHFFRFVRSLTKLCKHTS